MSENTLRNQEVTVNQSAFAISAKKVILALQHLIAMFGATVLVPYLTGFDPSVALVCAGVGTLVFHLVTKRVVPVFLGSSFAFIGVINAVKEAYNGDLAYAQGGIVVSGLIYIMVSLLVKKIGVDKIKKLLPSHVVGPMIIVIGLNLVPVAYGMAKNNFLIAGMTLAIALGITFLAKGFVKQLAILIAVTSGYLVSLSMGLVETSKITQAAVFAVPGFTLPKFDLAAIIVIVPVILAVFMEHLGDITTNGTVVGKNFVEEPGLNRTLLGDGLATLIAGFLGGPANTTYGENTGVLAITKNYDPAVLRIAAVFAIILGFIGKMGGFLNSIPIFVMGGISLMLFCMISLVGFRTIKDNKVQFNAKNVLVMGTIIFLGLYGTYVQGVIAPYLQDLTGINIGINIAIPVTDTVSISGLSLAALVGVILNLIVNGFSKEKVK